MLAIVAAGALIAPRFCPLIAPCIAQPIRLRFQHGVQRLLDRPPHDPTQMLAHPLVVDPDHIAELGPSAILFHGGSLLNWLRRSSRNANLTRAGATAQICERFFTSSPRKTNRTANATMPLDRASAAIIDGTSPIDGAPQYVLAHLRLGRTVQRVVEPLSMTERPARL